MDQPNAHILVVGAGSAGCVLAARLSARRLRVLLVEAGDEPADPRIDDPGAWALLQGTAIDWDFAIRPQAAMAGRAPAWPRGKVVGGSSAIHAMGHMRGHPGDIDAWAAQGATGWHWAALAPYYARSETSPFAPDSGYGADGPVHLMRPETPHPLALAHRAAGEEAGLAPIRDHNGPRIAGPTLNTLTIRDGRRQSVADAYLTPEVRARATLSLVSGVTVDRLTFDGDRATGIAGTKGGAPVTFSARAAVILAAGAIGSPMILMRSGLGPAADLAAHGITPRHDLPGMGRNLQDHLLSGGNVWRASRPVPMSTAQHSESLTYIAATCADPDAPPDLVVGICSLPITSEALADTPGLPMPGEGYTLMFGITHPRSRGHLRLTSADPADPPEIDPCYLTAPEDRDHFGQALDWARRIAHAPAYDDWRSEEVLPTPQDLASPEARDAFVARAAITHHHPVGTCRMGTDASAVVRPDLAVPGTEGLFVADGSVLPSLTTGPVNATIVALAERAAETLGARLGETGAQQITGRNSPRQEGIRQ